MYPKPIVFHIYVNYIVNILYFSEELMKRAGNIARDHLVSFGTCFGKFTKTQKFRLHITALDYVAPYAKVFILHFLLDRMIKKG